MFRVSILQLADDLSRYLEELRDLPFCNVLGKGEEGVGCFRYEFDKESGLGFRVRVENGALLLYVVTFGHLYGYKENTSFLNGLVRVGKGDDVEVRTGIAWTRVSRGMTMLIGDARYMKLHQLMKKGKFEKFFVGQYFKYGGLKEQFGYWDEHFGETPLYLEAGMVWDVTKYIQTKGSLKDFVTELGDILNTLWK